jgi:hypothetical protein
MYAFKYLQKINLMPFLGCENMYEHEIMFEKRNENFKEAGQLFSDDTMHFGNR